MPEGPGLNRRQWEEKLAAIGEHLRQHDAPDPQKRQAAEENLVYLDVPIAEE